MQFESPRFAGDPVLEEILNDPDTGTKKLQAGSPPESVKLVQRALWDMSWPAKAEPPINVPVDEFADGIYGAGTTRTVLQYKKQYHIHFPPSAPTGSFDGFAGPRTLASLDRHCVLYDEVDAMTDMKLGQMVIGGRNVHYMMRSYPIHNTMGVLRGASEGDEVFFVYANRGHGAFEVRGAIGTIYLQTYGGPSGRFGWPLNDGFEDEIGVRQQDFEFGTLRALPNGAIEVVGDMPPLQTRF
jgi:hypothetical protein